MKWNREITHPSHKHKLRMEYTKVPFSCDGCLEAGVGLTYKCDVCDFDLHKHCAVPPPILTHPFYRKCTFVFFTSTPGTIMRFCDACGEDVLGFVYHCSSCGFDLHPCCANLPPMLTDGEHSFYLSMKISSPCHSCGRKGLGWSYRSECKNYSLHVSCVKKLLVESWQAIYFSGGAKKSGDPLQIPSLRGALLNHHRGGRGGKLRKCCNIAAGAVRVIISAILGDPTAILSAVTGSLISK